jgi:DNA relaxase NicK
MIVEFCVDYLRITVHASSADCIRLYQENFEFILGKLNPLGHGAKGFKGVLGSLLGFQLRHSPGAGRVYCSFEFPGQVCKAIPPEFFKLFYFDLGRYKYKFKVTRLDLAFDNVPFSPEKFEQAILDDANRTEEELPIVRSLTQRNSLRWTSESLRLREDNSGLGRDTCYFGSRKSDRFMRVYNMRGPTRLELELKGDRASLVASKIFPEDVENWDEIAIAHLRDFIDIDRAWWHEFVRDVDRAYAKLHDPKEVSLEKTINWLLHQASPALAAVSECTDGKFLLQMDEEGRKRMRKRYKSLLSAHGKDK